MRPWAETDADDYCALVAERDDGVLTVEAARERIAKQLAASAETGIATLPICRRVEGDRDHVAPVAGKGEVVWLTRTLP